MCFFFLLQALRAQSRYKQKMDFQLARNLYVLARAQEETLQALLHIDSSADCLNREIIMAAASSEATEQLAAAKTNPNAGHFGGTI